MMVMQDHLATLSAELRFRPANNLYLSVIGGAVRDAATFSEMFQSITPTLVGGALELGYNSFLGPVKLALQWSDLYKWGGYLSLGFDF